MRKKLFGRTGAELSVLGFGCMRLPLADPKDPAKIDQGLAIAMIRRGIDGGINYVDSAWPYHGNSRVEPGESEPLVGKALQNGYRDKVYLATKMPTWFIENKKQMNEILDRQLSRLKTSHIDFYLAHNLNNQVWPAIKEKGLLEFMDEALKDGRIKQAGFSFHDRYDLFENIVESYDWSLAQIQYNYLDIEYQAGRRGLKLAAAKGLGVSIMEPLRGGFLINHIPVEMKKMLNEMRPEWSLADWAFRWLWNEPEVGLVLSGMSTMEQVEENLTIADSATVLSEKEIDALAQVRNIFRERLKANCTGCGYCLPCPEGVNIPKNFMFLNDYYLADAEDVRDRSRVLVKALIRPDEIFGKCVHCRQCEEKCPQNLPVSELMEDMAAVFGN